MGLFGPNRGKRVTDREYRRIMSALYGKLDRKERADIEQLFALSMEEEHVREEGISRAEYERAMTWLRENPKKHHLEDSDIKHVAQYFEKHLRD
jgi:hypothetical protein